MTDEQMLFYFNKIEEELSTLSSRIDSLENKIKLQELNSRLDQLMETNFSENTLRNRSEELQETLFTHILCIYLYRNTSNNFHHWCCEINAAICAILNSRLKKGGKKPSRKQALDAVLDTPFLLEDGLPMLLTKIEEKENKGNASLKSYKGKEQELKSFVIDTLKKIFSLQVINGECIEDLLSGYNTK